MRDINFDCNNVMADEDASHIYLAMYLKTAKLDCRITLKLVTLGEFLSYFAYDIFDEGEEVLLNNKIYHFHQA